jgi:hypothetical protein
LDQGGASGRLLYRVGKFVGEQRSSFSCPEREVSRAEGHMVSDGVRPRPDGTRGFSCLGVRMDSNVAEILMEALFKEPACFRVQRFPRGIDDLMDNRRRKAIGQSRAFSVADRIFQDGWTRLEPGLRRAGFR